MESSQPPILLICDCVSWRFDLFELALARIGDAVRRSDHLAELTLGYRLRDDVAFLAIEPGLFGDSRLGIMAVEEANLPGMRALVAPAGGPKPETLRAKALTSCDLVTSALTVADAVARLRGTLGMTDDRRATLRLAIDLSLRYSTPGGWIEASTRDLSLSGIFIRTQAHIPEIGETVEIELFSDTNARIPALATAARHMEEGFGARLSLSVAAQEAVYSRIRPLRISTRGSPDAANARVPAQLDVELALGEEVSQDRTGNISRGGAFIQSDAEVTPGTPVTLKIQVAKDESVSIQGDVKRVRTSAEESDPCGFGVEFRTLSTHAQEILDEFITETLIQPFARVLLGLPDEKQRAAVTAAMQKRRCEVLQAVSCDEVFEEIAANLLTLDYVLLDRALPGVGVVELLHRIRDAGGELDLQVAIQLKDGDEPETLADAGATTTVKRLPAEELAEQTVAAIARRRAVLKAGRTKKQA